MKHDDLRSLAHNMADSLASGIGLLVGCYEMDVYGETAGNPEKALTVDFLNGTFDGGPVTPSLARAVQRYKAALPDLCTRHDCAVTDFQALTARYYLTSTGRGATVTITDRNGRTTADNYQGVPLQRIRTLDHRGRIQTRR